MTLSLGKFRRQWRQWLRHRLDERVQTAALVRNLAIGGQILLSTDSCGVKLKRVQMAHEQVRNSETQRLVVLVDYANDCRVVDCDKFTQPLGRLNFSRMLNVKLVE